MGPSKSGYSGYRGRRTLNDTLKLIIMILSVLVLLVFIGLVMGQKYIVFTDDGLRLDLPFTQEKEQTPFEPGDISIVVQPSASEEQGDKLGQEEMQEENPMAALMLPLDAVLDGTAQQKLEEAGANAVILEMKNEEGKLGWVSSHTLAKQYGLNSQYADINEKLIQWNEGEVYTVAKVTCFRDNSIPYQRNDMALRASYGNWRDDLGLRWMNPDSEDVRNYLTQLCVELAELGFDEILLDCCGFPTQGSLGSIVQTGSYGNGQFETRVDAVLSQIRAALEPYDTVLAIRTNRSVLNGEDSVSGQTAALLERWAHRLWVTEDDQTPTLEELALQAGIMEAEKRLVRILPEDSGWIDTDCAFLG